MTRTLTLMAASIAFSAVPALAQADTELEISVDTQIEQSEQAEADGYIEKSTTTVPSNDLDATKAEQAFKQIDTSKDGLISKAEWADWQSERDASLDQFAEYDADSDGNIELSEYVATF